MTTRRLGIGAGHPRSARDDLAALAWSWVVMLVLGTVSWSIILMFRGERELESLVLPMAAFAPIAALPFAAALGISLPGLLAIRALGGRPFVVAASGAILVTATAPALVASSYALFGWPGSLPTNLDAIERDLAFALPFLAPLLVGGAILGLMMSRRDAAARSQSADVSSPTVVEFSLSSLQCPRCGHAGHVRAEEVRSGASSFMQFFCSFCGKAWTSRRAPRSRQSAS